MNYSRILLLAGVLGLAACQPKTGSGSLSTPADTSPAVATVNGANITQNFFDQYIKAITGKPSSELTAEQREKTTFDVGDDEWRKWMNQSFYVRQGVNFEEMSTAQRETAFGLLRASLSARCF